MFCRVGQNALAMQTHQPPIVDNHGESARLTPLDPPYVLKTHSLEGSFQDAWRMGIFTPVSSKLCKTQEHQKRELEC